MKVYERILEIRLRGAVEPTIFEEQSLSKRGVNDELFVAIKSLYSGNENYVISKNMKFDTFPTLDGLRQGE